MNLSQAWSELLLEHQVVPTDGAKPFVALDPVDGRNWISAISSSFAAMQQNNYQPIIICPAEVRLLVKSSTERDMPRLIVISIDEVMTAGNSISLEVLGEISKDGGGEQGV